MSYPATNYIRPHGRKEEITITLIRDEDADWLRTNNITISMEDLGGRICIYADYGRKSEDGDPMEHIIIAHHSDDCTKIMSNLVKDLKKILEIEK